MTILPSKNDDSDDPERGAEAVPRSERYNVPLAAGTGILYDHRLVHRGTSNVSSDGTYSGNEPYKPWSMFLGLVFIREFPGAGTKRPMLYLMYSKPWFREVKNFNDSERLLDIDDDHDRYFPQSLTFQWKMRLKCGFTRAGFPRFFD